MDPEKRAMSKDILVLAEAQELDLNVSRGGTKRLASVVDNVWEWVETSISDSPIQPVINLGIGLRRDNPPDFLIEAHKIALEMIDCNQYGPTGGLPHFTKVLSDVYSPLYGRVLDPNLEISVHSGGTEAILSTITAFVEPGDEVIVLEPAFDLYELHIRFAGGIVKGVAIHPPCHASSSNSLADEWTLDMAELERSISSKSRMLILNTPHNPLGKVFTVTELLAIGNLCVKYGIIILSDEVYERLNYTPSFPRIATLSNDIARHTVTIGSIGKSFNATGWRIGYAIGDMVLIKHVQNAHIILSYTTAGPAQMASAIGLLLAEKNGFWEKNCRAMKKKIEVLCEIFDELTLPYVKPSGSHYVLVNVNKIRIPKTYIFPDRILGKSWDWKLCWFLIREVGVATIPVSASFNNANSHVAQNYLRFVACKSDTELDTAKTRLRRLREFL